MTEKNHQSQASLAQALALAAQVLSRVREQGQSLPVALQAVCPVNASSNVRGAVQDLAYISVRCLASSEAVIKKLMKRAPAVPLRDLLSVALALLLDKIPRYADFTVVDQAVMAAANLKMYAHKGVVNAVLRNFLRQRTELESLLHKTETTRWNFPIWWINKLRAAYPKDWQQLLAISNQEPPMVLRVNLRLISMAQAVENLRLVGIEANVIGYAALKLKKAVAVNRLPGFEQGLFSVQDAGAQLAVPLLDVKDGMRVLDACAAPGGKTGHLLEIAKIEVCALEIDAQRAQRIQENLTRLQIVSGAKACVLVADATMPVTWWDGALFDRILVDAPCSASGIVRRHPDIRWLRRSSDVQSLVQQQRDILMALWPLLAPGGKLLYATCSVFPEEGEQQAQWFEKQQADAVRLHTCGQLLPKSLEQRENVVREVGEVGDVDDHDGFYYALFEKRLN